VTLRFEWDRRKAAANLMKHRVSFEEAKSIFFDEYARLLTIPIIPTKKIDSFYSG
jgi:uncharacterized DUF497 family protein